VKDKVELSATIIVKLPKFKTNRYKR